MGGGRVCHARQPCVSWERLSDLSGSIGGMDVAAMILGLALGALLGLAIGSVVFGLWLGRGVARERDRAVRAEALLVAAETEVAASRVRASEGASISDLLTPVRESLESLRRASDVASRERATAEATLTGQLTAVQERYQSLEVATTQLAAALAKGQTRGQWGEMQLESLLEHAGLLEGVHVSRQSTRQSGDSTTRPDIVVHLPGGGEVLVDAKFPFDAYWQAFSTDPGPEREALLRKHASDLLQRSRELSAKGYSGSDRSPDFVVMFLPLESLLSSALEMDGLLLEKTFERNVILATPTSMLALLRTIAFGYQRQLMADNAEQIRTAGAEMLGRMATLVEHLESLRRGLDQAVRGYNAFVGSFDRQAMRQARRMRDLGVDSTKSLDAPEPIDADLRASDPAALRSE